MPQGTPLAPRCGAHVEAMRTLDQRPAGANGRLVRHQVRFNYNRAGGHPVATVMVDLLTANGVMSV